MMMMSSEEEEKEEGNRINGDSRKSVEDDTNLQKPVVLFVAGATAGLVSTCVTYPFDIARTTLASPASLFTVKQPTTLRSFVKMTWRTKGVRGYYAGLGAAVVSIVPLMGANFLLYEKSLSLLDKMMMR